MWTYLQRAIVGSYARGEAHPDSDVDVVILCQQTSNLLDNVSWLVNFHCNQTPTVEDWGAITSLRTQREDGLEIEFGIGTECWAALPPDPGTRRVVSDGIRIIYDPFELLGKLEGICSVV